MAFAAPAQAQTGWTSRDKLALTYYFYWYNAQNVTNDMIGTTTCGGMTRSCPCQRPQRLLENAPSRPVPGRCKGQVPQLAALLARSENAAPFGRRGCPTPRTLQARPGSGGDTAAFRPSLPAAPFGNGGNGLPQGVLGVSSLGKVLGGPLLLLPGRASYLCAGDTR
jgi:hypothetical protein